MSSERMLAPPISTVGTMIRTKPATSRDCGLIMSLLSHLYLRRPASCHPRERCALSKAYSAECVEGKFCELRLCRITGKLVYPGYSKASTKSISLASWWLRKRAIPSNSERKAVEPMSEEGNRNTLERYVQALARQDLDTIEDHLHDDYVEKGFLGSLRFLGSQPSSGALLTNSAPARGAPRVWVAPSSSATVITPSKVRTSSTVSSRPGTSPRSPR